MALNRISVRCAVGIAAMLAATTVASLASADESRRRNDSAVVGRPAPAARAIAPAAQAPRPAAPVYQAAPSPSHNHSRGSSPGYSYGYVSPRPVYSPPLAVYPAPRIAVIAPPVIYSSPIYSSPIYSSPVYVSPGYSSSPYYAPAYTPAPVYMNPPAVAQAEPTIYYYCAELQDYYPNVQTCPSNWMRVLPDVPPQQ